MDCHPHRPDCFLRRTAQFTGAKKVSINNHRRTDRTPVVGEAFESVDRLAEGAVVLTLTVKFVAGLVGVTAPVGTVQTASDGAPVQAKLTA